MNLKSQLSAIGHWPLVILFILFILSPSAFSADVFFSLEDFAASPTTNRSVLITPLSLTASPGRLAAYDRALYNSGTNGFFWVSNMLAGTYQVTIQAPPAASRFTIYIDPTNSILYAGSNTVASPSATWPPASVAWSASASDLRYQRVGQVAANVIWPTAGDNVTAETNGLAVRISAQAAGLDTNAVTAIAADEAAKVTNSLPPQLAAKANTNATWSLSSITDAGDLAYSNAATARVAVSTSSVNATNLASGGTLAGATASQAGAPPNGNWSLDWGAMTFRIIPLDETFYFDNGTVAASNFSGAFTGSGAAVTDLNAAQLASGTVPTARLGSGTANSSTYLRGDSTWATPPGGGGITEATATNISAYQVEVSGNDISIHSRWLFAKALNIISNNLSQISAVTLGDSTVCYMPSRTTGKGLQFVNQLQKVFGVSGYGLGRMTAETTLGDVTTHDADDFATWITGSYHTINPTGSVRYDLDYNDYVSANQVRVFYLASSGAGTLDVQKYESDAVTGSAGSFSADNGGALACVVTNFPLALGNYQVVLTNTSAAAVSVLGVALINTNAPGVISWQLGYGGIECRSSTNANVGILQTVLSSIQPDIVLVEWKETATNDFASALQWHQDVWGQVKDSDWLYIGTSPSYNDTLQYSVVNNATMFRHAVANRQGWFDANRLYRDMQSITNLLWQEDGIHLTYAANRYAAARMWSLFGMDMLADEYIRNKVWSVTGTNSFFRGRLALLSSSATGIGLTIHRDVATNQFLNISEDDGSRHLIRGYGASTPMHYVNGANSDTVGHIFYVKTNVGAMEVTKTKTEVYQGYFAAPKIYNGGNLTNVGNLDVRGGIYGNAIGISNAPLAALASSGASTNQIPKWDGTAWVPANDEGGAGGGTEYVAPGQGTSVRTNASTYSVDVTGALTNPVTGNITSSVAQAALVIGTNVDVIADVGTSTGLRIKRSNNQSQYLDINESDGSYHLFRGYGVKEMRFVNGGADETGFKFVVQTNAEAFVITKSKTSVNQGYFEALKIRNAGGLTNDGPVYAQSLTGTNGYWMPTNALSAWPTAPRTYGEAYWANSNGVIYLLTSLPNSLTWSATNKIAP
jgi:hypothetical protein